MKKIHYWVVTPNAEIPVEGNTVREALNDAMILAEGAKLLGLRVTVLRHGNIVWMG